MGERKRCPSRLAIEIRSGDRVEAGALETGGYGVAHPGLLSVNPNGELHGSPSHFGCNLQFPLLIVQIPWTQKIGGANIDHVDILTRILVPSMSI